MRITRGVVILAQQARLPIDLLRGITGLYDAGGRANRIVGIAAALQGAEHVEVEAAWIRTGYFRSRGYFCFGAEGRLQAFDTGHCPDVDEGLDDGVGDPSGDGAHGAMEGQPGAMFIERGCMDGNHGRAEEVDAVFIADATEESIPGAADVGPVADTDQTLVAVAQLLASGNDGHFGLVEVLVELQKRLAIIEGIAN